MNSTARSLFKQIGPLCLQTFGERAQTIKTIEELGELTTALSKRLNGAPITDTDILDEVADVLIMANQMRHLYGEDAVDSRIAFKLNRTAQFMLTLKGKSHAPS